MSDVQRLHRRRICKSFAAAAQGPQEALKIPRLLLGKALSPSHEIYIKFSTF